MRYLNLKQWLTPHIGIKRWLLLSMIGLFLAAFGLALTLLKLIAYYRIRLPEAARTWWFILILCIIGMTFAAYGMSRLIKNLLAPYRRSQPQRALADVMVEYQRGKKGFKFVAIGGGTGLPASLRGMKRVTSNITAIVTVADDGGSSGRLRRDLGVPPPGDLRNNIAALADDENLLTRLFQYRFQEGDLSGHSFGNLFIAALANIVKTDEGHSKNSLAKALVEVERVLNIQGRVLPATLDDVNLSASVKLTGSSRTIRVRGESQIGEVNGTIESIELEPKQIEAYPPSVTAILEAEFIVIGPGSLYTSILPNLLVSGIAEALRATSAYKIYICNVATQPVETAGYNVADHIVALEQHIGRGMFQAVIANNCYPALNAGKNTYYVQPAPEHHEILKRYDVRYTDLTDEERPWRHDTYKLTAAILELIGKESQTPLVKSAVLNA